MQQKILRMTCALTVAGMLMPGCQSYQPRPLNADEHRQTWLDRSPQSAGVIDFARRLLEQDASESAFDPSDGVSLPEAEIIALLFNPELRLARQRAGVAAATAEHAGRWSDPEFSLDILRITESVSDPWVITPGLAFTIPISGRLEAETAHASAAHRAALLRVVEDEWRIRHAVREAWFAWSSAMLRAAETDRLIGSMDALVASTERLANVGEMPRTEAALFVIEQAQRRQELRGLEGRIAAAEQRIRMLIGLSPQAPITLTPSLESSPATDHARADAGRMAFENSPTLARLREEYEVAEQSLHREIRKQYPDLTIGPQYESDQGQSRIGFLGAIPLPILNANKQGIAEARAERELARAAFETACEQLEGALAIEHAQAESLAAQREELVAVVGPMVDSQVASAFRLLELGEGGGLVLLESMVRAHATKMQILDVRRDEALASATLAFLIGPAHAEPSPTTTQPDAQSENGEVQ